MKKIYLIVIALLINFNSFSQADLIGTWYLYYLNIDNTQINLPNNQPPYYDDYNFLALDFYDTDGIGNNINDFYAFGPCDHVSGDYTATNSSISLYNTVQSLGGCLGAGGTVPSFASNFYTIWESNLTYSIFGNNNETLVITNSLGNQAVYGRNTILQDNLLGEWFLYTVTVDNETLSFEAINYYSNIVFNETDFYGMVCDGFEGQHFIDSNNKLNITYFVQTLGGCPSYSPPPTPEYQSNLFNEVLWNDPLTNILDYTITGTGSDATLVLTDFEGDYAVYGRQTLSNNEFKALNELTIYPNPVRNILNVDRFDLNKGVTYTIYNSTGKILLDNIELKENSINIDFLNTGMYILKIESKNQIKFLKFIKQ